MEMLVRIPSADCKTFDNKVKDLGMTKLQVETTIHILVGITRKVTICIDHVARLGKFDR